MTDITYIVIGIILILGGLTALLVWPYIKAHVSSNQLATLAGIAQTAVFAAEKIFGAKMGEDKLAYAINVVKKWLEKRHLTFDDELIRAAIEAQVQQLSFDQKALEE